MITHIIAARGRGGYGDVWLFRWLWTQIRWWSIPAYAAAIAAFAFIRAFTGDGT